MRIIVYGIGAIGGTVAAALARCGQEVIGIARGAHLEAARASGILLRTPDVTAKVEFPCCADPTEIAFRSDDIVVLAIKSQDTLPALERLRAAGVANQAIFCMQNGVANERRALRLFRNVHGITVLMPAALAAPGEVCAFGTPRVGIFDLGRYPCGRDDSDLQFAQALDTANIAAFVSSNVMQSKYGKLLMNLNNIVEAALGVDADTKRFQLVLRAEAETVYRAAGITWVDPGSSHAPRAHLMQHGAVEGVSRAGSTTQSLARALGSVETDYLNGEIVLLGRLHGVPVPANSYFVDLSARMVCDGLGPGSFSAEEVKVGLTTALKADDKRRGSVPSGISLC
jgi:2-dehydropantoate 2-reductase